VGPGETGSREIGALAVAEQFGQQLGVLEQVAVAEKAKLDVSAPVPRESLGVGVIAQ
jgi:hypothetical protein